MPTRSVNSNINCLLHLQNGKTVKDILAALKNKETTRMVSASKNDPFHSRSICARARCKFLGYKLKIDWLLHHRCQVRSDNCKILSLVKWDEMMLTRNQFHQVGQQDKVDSSQSILFQFWTKEQISHLLEKIFDLAPTKCSFLVHLGLCSFAPF